MFKNGMRPVHPGEMLREDYLEPLKMSASGLAKALRVGVPTVNDIVREKRSVSPVMALRLSRYFGGTAQAWLNMQTTYDLKLAEKEAAARIEKEVVPRQNAVAT